MKNIVIAVVLGQLVGLLGYIEPTYVLLVLAAPLVTGAIAAARRIPLLLVAVVWASAGLNMLWVDWVRYEEDVIYHLALSVVMPLLAAAGYGLVTLVTRAQRRLRREDAKATA